MDGPGELSVREATAADIPELRRVRESVHENTLPDYSILRQEDYRDHIDGAGRSWVAELDGQVVGFASVNLTKAEVWALFVEPPREGRGIGQALQAHMLAYLRDVGCPRITLFTGPDTRATRFYRASGWNHCGTAPNGDLIFEMILGS